MKRILVIATFILIALTIIGCGGKSKKIDTYLNGLELSVGNDEKSIAAGDSIFKSSAEIDAKYSSDLSIGDNDYAILTKGNPSQQKKFADLKTRIDIMKANLSKTPQAPAEVEVVERIVEKNAPTTPVVKKDEGNSMDKWLDSYEQFVVTYEQAGDKISINDIMKINEKLAELNKKKTTSKMTPAQLTRLTQLIGRLTKVMQKTK